MGRWRLLAVLAGAWAAAGGAQAACQLAKMAEFPVTMHGLSPWTSAKINGHEVSFILDSGAGFSSITPAKAAELKLDLEPVPWNFSVTGVGGEARRVDFTTVNTFTILGVPIPKLQFLVVGQGGGDGSAGLLGQTLLHLADVEYDLAHGSVWLIKPHDCGRASLAYWAKDGAYNTLELVQGMDNDRHTYGYVTVNGTRIKAMFDTGANTSVITTAAAARAGLTPQMQGAQAMGGSMGVGSRIVRNWSVPVASFKIGDEEIKATRIRIGDMELHNADMLLGADFFLSHHVYVSNNQRMIYFTYNGGNVFNLAAVPVQVGRPGEDSGPSPAAGQGASADGTPTPSGDEPRDADGFSRRGSALAARHEYEAALKDFTKAIELAPDNGAFYYQRALAHLGLKQAFLAMADLDETLKRQPNHIDALVARAELRIAGQDRAGAGRDLDMASSSAAAQADIRLRLAEDDERLDRFEAALPELDRWIAAHPEEAQSARAYYARCWSRATLNRELDRALDDCNRSIRMARNASNLDGRGLVHLRRGEYDRAIEDYDASLALQPKSAWALYGRGLAKLYKGDKAGGEADLAAAKALGPRIPEIAKNRGLTPPPTPAPPAKP